MADLPLFRRQNLRSPAAAVDTRRGGGENRRHIFEDGAHGTEARARMWPAILSKPHAPAVVASLALLASTVAAVTYSHRLQTLTAAIVAENVSSLRAAEELELAIRDMRSALYQFALTGDAELLESLPSLDREFRGWLEAARLSAVSPQEQEYFGQIVAGYEEYATAVRQVRRGEYAAARRDAARSLADSFSERLVPLCHAFLEYNEGAIEESAKLHRAIAHRLQFTLVLAGFLVPLAGVLLGYLISRGMMQKLMRSREELVRSEQLAAVGRLAAGMAHELRNPLTSIMMMVQTADRDDPADLAVIEDEVRRMERTIQSCLDFAKPPKPRRGSVDVRDVIADACRLVEGRVRRQQVELLAAPAAAPLLAYADGHQLHQVFVNLLLNAIESVRPRGRLGVASGAEDGHVVVRVWDEGPGIPGHLLATLFDPFVSSKATGTGLGLSISRQIIESHGGRIEARNRPEGGAEFLVRLPSHGRPSHAHAARDRRRTEHPARLPQGLST